MAKRKEPAGVSVEDDVYAFDDLVVDKIAAVRAGTTTLNASAFAFFIISKGRPDNVPRMEALFAGSGETPTWLVGSGEVAAYRKSGAQKVVEGGKLCPSRNLALDTAAANDKVCVQLSDDLKHLEYLEHSADGGFSKSGKATEWDTPSDQQQANSRSQNCDIHRLSPVGAARLCEAFMRGPVFAHTDAGEAAAAAAAATAAPVSLPLPPSLAPRRPRFAGAYPCTNGGFSFKAPPVQSAHFVVGDFIVVDVRRRSSDGVSGEGPSPPAAAPLVSSSSPVKTETAAAAATTAAATTATAGGHLRFDEDMLLKEDYDFTCQHLAKYGAVCRLNRLFVKAEHRDNPGGAVADRNATKENRMIKLLTRKWPGVFKGHRRALEVSMWWKCWQPFQGVKIARRFPLDETSSTKGGGGAQVFLGEVAGFRKPKEDDDDELWTVEYEDGDAEDLDRAELYHAMALFKELHDPNGNKKNEKTGGCEVGAGNNGDVKKEKDHGNGGQNGTTKKAKLGN